MKGTTWGALALTATVSLTGCSSFDRRWREAGATGAAGSSPLDGRWIGEWRSDQNHHHGALRCIVTHVTNNLYSARFHARYRRVVNLTFGYTAQLVARQEGDRTTFRGEADLGWYAGGVYRYDGNVTGTNFQSTYSARYDHGNFFMTRPPAQNPGR